MSPTRSVYTDEEEWCYLFNNDNICKKLNCCAYHRIWAIYLFRQINLYNIWTAFYNVAYIVFMKLMYCTTAYSLAKNMNLNAVCQLVKDYMISSREHDRVDSHWTGNLLMRHSVWNLVYLFLMKKRWIIIPPATHPFIAPWAQPP